MTTKKRQLIKKEDFSPAEQRAARSERILVNEAKPYGWMARSEGGAEADYHLFCEPQTRRLACTCADFIFRGNAEPGYECKHVSAVLKFIARRFLETEYEPRRKPSRAA